MILLAAGLVCIFAPDWILCATGMGKLEDEPVFVGGVRIFGVVLIGIAIGPRFF